MPKFYSEKAFQEMVEQYVANGYHVSTATEMVLAEEAISMQEWDEFVQKAEAFNQNSDAEDWIDMLDATSFHTDIDN